jgi:hypothetical protein
MRCHSGAAQRTPESIPADNAEKNATLIALFGSVVVMDSRLSLTLVPE